MTGLSLQQSQLEVSQQSNLKRMLCRIRASRRAILPKHKRTSSFGRTKHLSSLILPSPALGGYEGGGREYEELGDEDEDGLSVRRMDVTIEIGDNPSSAELKKRIAKLFNTVFSPQPPIEAKHVCADRISGAMTNCIFMVTISPAPAVLMSATPQAQKWAKSREFGSTKSTAAIAAVSEFFSASTTPTSGTTTAVDEPARLPAKYLLRVYGTGVDEFLSREKELYWLSQLTSLGFGPKLFGIFGNGRLEEFLESSTLTKEDIRDQSTSKHIARRMCELHSLVSYYRPFDSDSVGRDEQPPTGVDLSGRPELWKNADAWMQLVKRKWQRVLQVCARNAECIRILNSWDQVESAARGLKQIIDAADSPVVFAHDDLQYGNILKLSSTGELVVVDFEYAGYNYRGFDIANHFCEWMTDYHHPEHPHLLNEDMYPTREQRVHFFRTYVKAKAFLDANMRADAQIVESESLDHSVELKSVKLSESRIADEVESLDKEVEPFVMASHFQWGVWGLLQACSSDIDFDYVGYAAQRLSIFLRLFEKAGSH
ncbi:hypothetical protein GGI12_000240 [Dipsacomyces acuminosporus]|nr:hypothetical protein GGI12_000240 [Dipsacomyces acuminosporus]